MSSAVEPVARRYWFADAVALAAVRDAEDALEWNASDLPVTAFCLDDACHEALQAVAEEGDGLRLVDAQDAARVSEIVSAELEREIARYLQFAFHAIEDFGPALDLLRETLEESDARVVQTDMLATGPFETGEAEALTPERSWIVADRLREFLSGRNFANVMALQAAIRAAAEIGECKSVKLIAGAIYLSDGEYPELAGAERDAASWRARTAAAWSEIDRLQSEKRVRAGREQALKARHQRDLARQAECNRHEIDRLHRAAGWAGRWRARFGRLFGK